MMHQATVIQIEKFRPALTISKISAAHHIELVNSINPFRIEGQKTARLKCVINWEMRRIFTCCRSGIREHYGLLEGLSGISGRESDDQVAAYDGISGGGSRPDGIGSGG